MSSLLTSEWVDQFMLIQMERHKRALYAASAQPRDTNVRA
jgi:hypothetical protein